MQNILLIGLEFWQEMAVYGLYLVSSITILYQYVIEETV